MNKKVYKYLYLVSILMVCVFIILIIVDYSDYDPITTSAPFYVDILLRAVEFVLPAFVFACVSYIYQKKNK